MAEDGVEEGLSWLPSHVFHEACNSKESMRKEMHPNNRHQLELLAAPPILQQPKSSLKQQHRASRNATNWACGGLGMQAIFLDSSGQRSCGTGVFLPRFHHPTRKPACSPVLLPSRVVQALNLNVHELGLQIKPLRDRNKDSNNVDIDVTSNKKGKDTSAQCCIMSQNPGASPEIFLPKEWTY